MHTIQFTVYGPIRGYFIPIVHDVRTTDYDVGYTGSLDTEDDTEPKALLERIFIDGNGEGNGPGFTVSGRSMSAGDVVHLQGHGVWLCDSRGWTRLDDPEAGRFPLSAAV